MHHFRTAARVTGMLLLMLVLASSVSLAQQSASKPSVPDSFRAGAVAVDISPTSFPVRVAGGFLEGTATKLNDPLFARAIVIDDGAKKIAMVVVDTCMMTQTLIDAAKQSASQATGIPVEHMMVSATHTHSAPAAMACLGTRQDKAYADWLPGKIAEAIVGAHEKLQPARIGWASIDDWEHTHNRRWIRKPESKVVDPFGEATGLAHMHPGYESSAVIGPSGPVDPALSIVALQTRDGKPLAVLANYSQHYFGSGPVSADYYGLFCKHIAEIVGEAGDGNGPFVAAISQGTSGDLMWMDYGTAAKSITLERYAEEVAKYAELALAKVEYHAAVPINIVEKNITLKYRVPDDKRLEWARPIASKIENELPKSLPEVYAMEALILHERQKANVKLQAIQIGDLTIATLPNEVYALTGLKLRGRSPAKMHFNIELANGAEGYIPPPEQHTLGGYTTWPARTAGLEVQAETKIVDTLVEALEQATGKDRRAMQDVHGPYANAVLAAKPVSYWRMDDEDGATVRNAVAGAEPAKLSPGYALYLPGVASGTGTGLGEQIIASEFSGPTQINRAIHFAGSEMSADASKLREEYSFAFWFWLGERSGASERSGQLCVGPNGESVLAKQSAEHLVQIQVGDVVAAGEWRADAWNFAVVVRDKAKLRIHINGHREPALEVAAATPKTRASELRFGVGMQGKLDEVAVFDRALNSDEIAQFWNISKVTEQLAREESLRKRVAMRSLSTTQPIVFPATYATTLAGLKPTVYETLASRPNNLSVSGAAIFSPSTFGSFSGARLEGQARELKDAYTVSLWFRNELPVAARPVTAYLFSRGPKGDAEAPGDQLGIGGTYQNNLTGKLIFFNGNASNQVVAGRTEIPAQAWNHVVMIRDGARVRVYLNGNSKPEIDAQVEVTAAGSHDVFFGARNDNFAPLQGNLAHVVLFNRALQADETQLLYSAAEQGATSIKNTANKVAKATADSPDSQPLSVEESLAKIHVPRGYRVEVVAAEPETIDPVAFDWDAAGRLWVVEMADYPLGMDGKGKPGGRVRVLEDKDHDGRYETSRLFADGLSFPNGILSWRDGVLVTAAPEILYLRDTDGDGKADQREVLFSGFNEGNQQLRMNHLRWGLDNWVYCANGGHHANHGLETKVTSHRKGESIKLGSRDFRFQPDTGELQLESGPSQYGRNRDTWGHWFGTQNANPLWHYVLSDRYLARNPHVPTASPLKHIVGPGSPVVYPASQLEKRFHSFEQSGRFTSACSGMIYNDDLIFGRSSLTHAFTCEPFHNLVQHNVLSDDGVSFKAQRPVGEGQMDFFASEDRWCRPVMVRTGPDGGLWVADMYRYMIEHPDWLPPEGKAELLPHYRLGEDRGRIYRIVPVSSSLAPRITLDQANTAQLVAAFDSPNDWQRDKAHQLLLWRDDRSAIPLLEKSAVSSLAPQTRLQALCVLDGLGALSDGVIVEALNDRHPRVRENAVRLAEPHESPAVIGAVCELANDADDKVCLQLALSLGQWKSPLAGSALTQLAIRFADDPYVTAAIMSSALPHSQEFVRGLVKADPKILAAFRVPLLRQSIGAADETTLAVLMRSVLSSPEAMRLQTLDEFLLSLQRVGSDLDQLAKVNARGNMTEVLEEFDELLRDAERRAKDKGRPAAERIAAAKVLCRPAKYRESGVDLLAPWLQPQTDPQLQVQVIEAMAQSGIARVPETLSSAWSQLSPELRGRALDAWLSRETWTNDLLDRLESNRIPLRSLDLTQRSRLVQHPAKSLAQRAKVILDVAGQSTRKQIVDQYMAATKLPADANKGQQIYVKSCASCHRRGDQGQEVGPNMATVIEHSSEKLLTNILDPNADIQPGYQAYSVLLDSGEILSGVIAGETANSITIKQANAVTRTVSRDEIERLQNSNVSFMPEGLEQTLSPQDVADLLAFLRTPLK
ncbi:MAG: neutral/alkaline non-lysosomal ceramidase N-terminal domain-containing protein [Pirellulaceae bacterium]|nr:neutral/alkaline non-lysosomal ceramidase N-terminal domain-containing protein [Pirellulaceae bacterium]